MLTKHMTRQYYKQTDEQDLQTQRMLLQQP